MDKQQNLYDLGLFSLRLTVGLYMLLAGVGKVQSEISNGLGSFYKGPFTAMQPDWLPGVFAAPYGYALPWLEVIVGVFLIVGLLTRLTSFVGLGMLVSFTIALAMMHGRIQAQAEGPGGPFSANYIQWSAYFLLLLVGPGRWSVDTILEKKRKAKS